MIPKLIHQIHLGGEMTDQVKDWCASVGLFHPGFSRMIWNEHSLQAVGIDLQQIGKSAGAAYASITNAVRLHLVFKFGGIYLDTDCECVGWLDPYTKMDAFVAEQDRPNAIPRYCNAVFGAAPGNPWIKWQIDHMGEYINADAAWGVYLMTAATHAPENKGRVSLIPKECFYPWTWGAPADKRVMHPSSVVMHHWSGSWIQK